VKSSYKPVFLKEIVATAMV